MLENIPLYTLFIILIVLFFLSAFFSGSETAFMSVNRYQIAHLAANGNKAAQRVLKLLGRPDRFISLILLGNNFVNIVIAQLATYVGYRLYGNIGVAIATGALTFLILVFAELTPKILATRYSQKISMFTSWIYLPLMASAYPLISLTNFFSNTLLAACGASDNHKTINPLNRGELRTLLSRSEQSISTEYQKMLLGILDLERRTVEDIMIPRNEIQGVDLSKSIERIKQQLTGAIHTRMPLYNGDINHITGILHLREALTMIDNEELTPERMVKLAHDPYYIPEHTNLYMALINFKLHKQVNGLIVDEYGDIQGLITLEDLLEEIVGEFTNNPTVYDQEIKPQPDGSVIVDGSCHVREFNRTMQWELNEQGPKTISGLIIEHLETIPEVGTGLLIQNYPFEVIKTGKNTIRTVKIGKRLKQHDPEATS